MQNMLYIFGSHHSRDMSERARVSRDAATSSRQRDSIIGETRLGEIRRCPTSKEAVKTSDRSALMEKGLAVKSGLALEQAPDCYKMLEGIARAVYFFRGTFAPFFRASERPIAIACFLLFTFPPLPRLPERNLPFALRCIARRTLFPAALAYLAI
jgi:hypothetical protein